jgi:GGDEF domain-containing protein
LISIRKSVNDLERLDEERRLRDDLCSVLHECFALAIDSSAHCAIEVDPSLAVDLRTHLKVIGAQARTAVSGDQLRALQSSFHSQLCDYRDQSAERLKKVRKEIVDATAAMQIFAATVASNGENHEQEVSTQLRGLEHATQNSTIEQIRTGVGAAIDGIESSVLQMKRGNQLIVAQLQDEIRLLHQEIEQERKALYTDVASGAWNRQKVNTHLDNLLRQNRPFCVLLLRVRNLKHLETQYSRDVVHGTLKVLLSRFAAMTGEEGVLGRWSTDQFVAILDMPAARAIALSAEAAAKLSETYIMKENGRTQKVTVHATAGVTERPSGGDSTIFHQKLEQLSEAISSA